MENVVQNQSPSLDEIAQTLSRATSLPPAVRGDLIAHCAAIIAALSVPSVAPDSACVTQKHHELEDDTWLSADEAAALLHKPRRRLFRNARRLPFTRRVSRKSLLCSRNRLERWLQTQGD
jgi:hypothetical protein